MRICVIGGGLAGALLAWRLAGRARQVDIFTGDDGERDATDASGGGVRGYETHPVQRELAVASLAELLSSRVLREWADFRRTGSAYLREGSAELSAELAEVDRCVYGSVSLAATDELTRAGWAGLPAGTVAVTERFAGYISPHRLRSRVLADLAGRQRTTVRTGAITALVPHTDGTVDCRTVEAVRRYDVVVIAAGAWTPALLRASGLPADGYRTKAIQYTVYPAGGWRPPVFVDETSGLFGRPTADGAVLLGLPTQSWGAGPGESSGTTALHVEASRVARTRFPRLRLGPPRSRISATDCYAGQPVLRLRPVGAAPRLHTFTGGAGGSVKTALAASSIAAAQLTAD
ncbi:glycine/D-amino acid oxidase-like deaminating enzyme [Allocatelliglobosispora scoriae]|uniref:Glycine/D-amino acid oxidase-like deaminating enzyme n=1 Tax=Allocatelliglobosispora scoriae TaxID=643052 RepID=A0A841BQL1_9ACTN|nr:FAD-dependent oxidoreductase [Allocatelliglobosispora scoriae]MBB5869042.1 glycine/D-amino acid oxidase-like deaminating enzyme [Allocatelliglobosispora scoriae]